MALAGVDLLERQLVVLGHVDVDDEAPLAAVHGLAVLGRGLLGDLPVGRDGLGSARQPRAEREDAQAMLARADHARGRHDARHRDGEVRVGVGREMQPRLAELEPVGLHAHGLLAAQERHDGVERILHSLALGDGLDAHHVRVGDEGARPTAEHRPPARHVVELDEALRDQEGVMVGQARDAGAQHDVARALGGVRDHDLGRGDQLPPRRVVLADPDLVVAQVVEPLDQLHVAIDGERRILAHPVEGRQEDTELHPAVGHGFSVKGCDAVGATVPASSPTRSAGNRRAA